MKFLLQKSQLFLLSTVYDFLFSFYCIVFCFFFGEADSTEKYWLCPEVPLLHSPLTGPRYDDPSMTEWHQSAPAYKASDTFLELHVEKKKFSR